MNNIQFFHQKVQEDCQLDTETRTEKKDLSRHSVLHLSNNKSAINTRVSPPKLKISHCTEIKEINFAFL